MTECEEVAATLPLLPKGATMNEARAVVRRYMRDETDTVIDNVAEALLERSRRSDLGNVPTTCIEHAYGNATRLSFQIKVF